MFGGGTVKGMALLARLSTVTITFPVVAPTGTGTMMLVFTQLVAVAATPLNVTVLLPCAAPKLAPVIVTGVPTSPKVGDKAVIVGGTITVKKIPLLALPFTVTMTFPVVAPAGTCVTIWVLLNDVTLAGAPSNVTVVLPCAAPKFAPVIVTATPITPKFGDNVVMLGPSAPAGPTVSAVNPQIEPVQALTVAVPCATP